MTDDTQEPRPFPEPAAPPAPRRWWAWRPPRAWSWPEVTWTWGDVLRVLALSFAGYLLAGAMVSAQTPAPGSIIYDSVAYGPEGARLEVAERTLEFAGILIGVLIFIVGRRRSPWAALGFRRVERPILALAVTAALAALHGAQQLRLSIAGPVDLGQWILRHSGDLNDLFLARTAWGVATLFALNAIVVPFEEELFYRGVLYPKLRGWFGPWLAVPLSAGAFMIVHDRSAWETALVMGALTALLRERCRSILPGLALHAIQNAFALGREWPMPLVSR